MTETNTPQSAPDATAQAPAAVEKAHPGRIWRPSTFACCTWRPCRSTATPLRFVQLARVERHAKGQSLREQDVKLRKRDVRLELFRHENGSLRFTIACQVAFCLFQAGLLSWMAMR